MTLGTPAAQFGPCGRMQFAMHSLLDVVQSVGQLVIPMAAVWIIFVISKKYPTGATSWTSLRVSTLLGRRRVTGLGLLILVLGLAAFGASIVATVDGGEQCGQVIGALGAAGLLGTLCGAMLAGVAWAVTKQAGWVVLASFFALDLWIIFGMVMMHLKDMPKAPDAMLLLAFIMHAVCMYLTTVWAFHARKLSPMAQVRVGEAGRSIGAVWVFLAAYIVVGFFHDEAGPFDSAAGGAVLSALTLSALALTMGSGYTKYREVMAEHAADPRSAPPISV